MKRAHAWVGAVVVGLLVAMVLSDGQGNSRGAAGADPAVNKVECDKGQTLTQALKTAKAGDTLQVTGACQERVTITTDRLTLDGGGSAVLDGGGGGPTEFDGVVTIDGAHGVTITGFTIQHSGGEGTLGLRGAAFTVQNTTVQNNAGTGIAISGNSTADLTDCTLQGNRLGLDVFTISSAILRGAITFNNNTDGVNVNGESILEIRGAQVQVNNNGGSGLLAGSGQVAIFAFTESQGSTLTANGNGLAGIGIANGSLNIFGSSTIRAANNTIGIFLPSNGNISVPPSVLTTFLLENNGIGLNFVGGSGAMILSGLLTVANNGTGVLADGAGTVSISIPPNSSAIENNGTDVDLKFGIRATFDGVTIGTMTCDPTVLSRGTAVCP